MATSSNASHHQSDPSYDVFGSARRPLDSIFQPRTVAVIGATEREGSVGRTLLFNLISSPFGGTVYPVNPTRQNVLGIKAHKRIGDIPERIDLAVIATPAPTVPGVIRECLDAGVEAAIIISAGFREVGPEGRRLEEEIWEMVRGKMRVIGPNCLGVMRPVTGLNATFAGSTARAGNVAFISQSGALLTSILDWSLTEHVGFSAIVSIGSMLDVGWGDLITHFGDDPRTKSIVLYMESIGDARAFLSAAREVALQKPIIVIKAGRTEQAAQAAVSHTGTLAGSDAVLNAAFRRTGVLRVDAISDLFYVAEVLAKQPRPQGKRLTILTNAGGPGVLATDSLVMGGGELAQLADDTTAKLDMILPPHWSKANPVDILGDAGPERYAESLEVLGADKGSDGYLVVLTPQAMTDPTRTAEMFRPLAHLGRKPVLASWMGGSEVAAGEEILNRAGIPTFSYPDTAARIFNYMWQYSYNLRGIYETPILTTYGSEGESVRARADELIQKVRNEGRTLLTEIESKQLMELYDIPVVRTLYARTEEDAVGLAEEIGYPVVLKLHSTVLTHKTDVGGVMLNLRTTEGVRNAFNHIRDRAVAVAGEEAFAGVTVQTMVRHEGYELIIGSTMDVQFGPVLLFGAGGTLVEVYRDRALALPPLTTTLARRMMEQTRIYEALKGVRGRAATDLAQLEQILVRFGELVVENRSIKEIDINPMLASTDGFVALDARVVLHEPDLAEDEIPELAIRPYPQQFVGTWTMRDGRNVIIRPIRPEDEPLLVDFHETLSEQSVYLRYASVMKLSQRVAHDRLARICFIDYDREMAFVAEMNEPGDRRRIVAVGRLTRLPGTNDAEFAMVIQDSEQRQGLGTEMLRRLIDAAREEKIERITADILLQNQAMQRVCEKMGFVLHRSNRPDDSMIRAIKIL